MTNEKYLFGATLEISVDKTILYSYKVGGIKSTRQDGGKYVLYDTEGEIRNTLTRREVKALTEAGELVKYLRHIGGNFIIKILNFNELCIREFEKEGDRHRKYILDEVVPRIQKGEYTKIGNLLFVQKVIMHMGDDVSESVLKEIASQCGYKVDRFIDNYHEWSEYMTKEWSDHYRKTQRTWWAKLNKLKVIQKSVPANDKERA